MIQFLRNIKDFACNNTLYRKADANFQIYPPLLVLRRAHRDHHLLFVFARIEKGGIAKLIINSLVKHPLDIANLEDACTTRVRQVTLVPSPIQDMTITFGTSSLNSQPTSMKLKSS